MAAVLDWCTPGWERHCHKHLTFRADYFQLTTLDGLAGNPIDLSHLESLDLSYNQLKELHAIEGKSSQLASLRIIQGAVRFSALKTLKARRNQLDSFVAVLPSLRELDLAYNALTVIPPMAGLKKVEVLILSHNKMTGSWETLRLCEQLKRLDLAHNLFDFKPSQLDMRLQCLAHIRCLVSLRLLRNPFTVYLPEYQSFALRALAGVQTLDDITDPADMQNARETAEHIRHVDAASYDMVIFDRMKVSNFEDDGTMKLGEGALPHFWELASSISEALEDPSTLSKALKQLVRNASRIFKADSGKIEQVFRAMHGQKDPQKEAAAIESAISGFLGNYSVLLSRIEENQSHRIMMFRSLAKLGVVHLYHFGEKCIATLGWMLKRSSEHESEILDAVQEIIVEPLANRNLLDPITVPTAKALAKFTSPRLPQVLSPIAAWLGRMYCNYGAMPQKDITHLLAEATKDPSNTEAVLDFDHSSKPSAAGSGAHSDQFPRQVSSALDNKQLAQNESLREQYLLHLYIASNTARLGPKVVDVYHGMMLHKLLLAACKTFFRGSPHAGAEKQQANESGEQTKEVAERIDLVKLKTLDVRTCAAILDAITALMSMSAEIMQEVVSVRPPEISIVDFLLIAPTANPIADPVLIAASVRGLHVVLAQYSRENSELRRKEVKRIIEKLQLMTPLMELFDDSSLGYLQLFTAAEKHLAERSANFSRKYDSIIAPAYTSLLNPLMHDVFEAIVNLVGFFTEEGKADRSCDEVSNEMNRNDRERTLFKLLKVPSSKVREAVMNAVSKVDMADMSVEEVGDLVKLLDGIEDVSSEEQLLEKVMAQLGALATSRSASANRGAGAALRTEFAEQLIKSVVQILLVNARRNMYGVASEEEQKVNLARSCVSFLKTASEVAEFRSPHMRTSHVSTAVIDALKFEDMYNNPMGPDIMVECTWTGRSVETLLECLAGVERVRANCKVAYRVIRRIADVLTGVPEDDEDRRNVDAATECEMWEEGKMKSGLRVFNDPELEDRQMQQSIFASFCGIERVVQFLYSLISVEERPKVKMRETKLIEESTQWLHATKSALSVSTGTRSLIDNVVQPVDAADNLVQDDGDPVPNFYYEGLDTNNKEYANLSLPPHNFCKENLGEALSICFVACWSAPLNSNGTVIDFGAGTGQDNIKIYNQGSSPILVFSIQQGCAHQTRLMVQRAIIPGEFHRYLFTVSSTGHMMVYMDGDVVGQRAGFAPLKVARPEMFVGKSATGHCFKGVIRDLMIWNGVVVEWDTATAQDDEPEETEFINTNSKTVIEVLTAVSSDPSPIEKQPLQVGVAQAVGDNFTISEDFWVDPKEGIVNCSYLVAAMLRCAFAMLRLPATDLVSKDTMDVLRSRIVLTKMLSLVKLCGVFDCCVAAKFLRIMHIALFLPPSQTSHDVDSVVTYDILIDYCKGLCSTTSVAVKQTSDRKLVDRGRMLSIEIASLMTVICKAVACCTLGKDDTSNALFVEACLQRLMPMVMVRFIIDMVLYVPQAGQKASGAGALSMGLFKNMSDQTAVWEHSQKVLTLLLGRCPEMKYMILEAFSTAMVSGVVPMRRSFLSALLAKTSSAQTRLEFEKAINGPSKSNKTAPLQLIAPSNEPLKHQQAIFSADVEAHFGGTESPVKGSFTVIVTNTFFYLVSDVSSAQVVVQSPFSDMTRLTASTVSQLLYVSWAARSTVHADGLGERHMALICHYEADRNELLGLLHNLSQPEGGLRSHRVPLQSDAAFRRALDEHVTEGVKLTTFACGESGTELFALSDDKLYKFHVNFESWLPPVEKGEFDESEEENGSNAGQPEVHDHHRSVEAAALSVLEAGTGDAPNLDASRAMMIAEARKRIRSDEDNQRGGFEFATAGSGTSSMISSAQDAQKLGSLTEVRFLPDTTPTLLLGFPGERVAIQFFDDMSRENWRRILIAQLCKDAAQNWQRFYDDKGKADLGS